MVTKRAERSIIGSTEGPTGTWIVCGYGRFGQAIHNEMVDQGSTVKVVEIKPNIPELAPDAIIGDGTLAETLHRADIDSSVGIIAGTDDDSNNSLSS